MEPVTVEALEAELTTIEDSTERRRMRGRIRRLRRKAGVSPTRVLGTRARSRDPYANETPEQARERIKSEASALGLRKCSVHKLDPQKDTLHAFTVHCMVATAINKYEHLHGATPQRYAIQGVWLVLS